MSDLSACDDCPGCDITCNELVSRLDPTDRYVSFASYKRRRIMKNATKVVTLLLIGSFIGWWACPNRGFALGANHQGQPSMVVNRHAVVVSHHLPWCVVEDGGPLPCERITLKPRSYWIGAKGVIHFVWPVDPTTVFHGWRWRTKSPDAKCITNGSRVLCPWDRIEWRVR